MFSLLLYLVEKISTMNCKNVTFLKFVLTCLTCLWQSKGAPAAGWRRTKAGPAAGTPGSLRKSPNFSSGTVGRGRRAPVSGVTKAALRPVP